MIQKKRNENAAIIVHATLKSMVHCVEIHHGTVTISKNLSIHLEMFFTTNDKSQRVRKLG